MPLRELPPSQAQARAVKLYYPALCSIAAAGLMMHLIHGVGSERTTPRRDLAGASRRSHEGWCSSSNDSFMLGRPEGCRCLPCTSHSFIIIVQGIAEYGGTGRGSATMKIGHLQTNARCLNCRF
jgi:hypothetical protein